MYYNKMDRTIKERVIKMLNSPLSGSEPDSLKSLIIRAANRFESPNFVLSDPIQFPRRYVDRRDIEISAFISSWISYGSRKVFLKILHHLHDIMDSRGGPYNFIMSYNIAKTDNDLFFCNPDDCLYRFYKWSDFIVLTEALNTLYSQNESMEQLFSNKKTLLENVDTLCSKFTGVKGIPIYGSRSANKRLHMFLRWMIRKNSPVDIGIWNRLKQSELIIPLDTHVFKTALKYGLTYSKTANFKAAADITMAMAHIWPEDPVKGDFALYGLGITEQ
ncbi:MAG TPA: TIGR02757 family protein [Bacteroidaceae bacterium]|nr:TIGR02757 family protein [Bacteroidaceae bacterium]